MKNPVRIDSKYAAVLLPKWLKSGPLCFMRTYVDSDVLPLLDQFPGTWSLVGDNLQNRHYAAIRTTVNGRRILILMHRLIMNASQGMLVDHINNWHLDNRRENLRIVTRFENMQNRAGPPKNNTSGYRGVSFDKRTGTWTATVVVGGRRHVKRGFQFAHEAGEYASDLRSIIMPASSNDNTAELLRTFWSPSRILFS